MKPLWQSKVFWINFIAGLGTFLEAQEFTNVVPQTWIPYINMFVFGLNIILRYMTVDIIGKDKTLR
jgi:hypothetical protein